MAFRFGVLPRVPSSLVAIFALMAVPHPSAGPQIRPEDSIERARHLAWLNNWSEAARVLERLKATGRLIGDDRTTIFSKAVEIRGNIEALPLPSAASDLARMLSADAALAGCGKSKSRGSAEVPRHCFSDLKNQTLITHENVGGKSTALLADLVAGRPLA